MLKRFELHRDEDLTGVSGTGIVAPAQHDHPIGEGHAIGGDWPTSICWYDRGVEAVERIHGHNGATRLIWIDS